MLKVRSVLLKPNVSTKCFNTHHPLPRKIPMAQAKTDDCKHCEGLGYVSIRDCVGSVQYESTCQMCGGTGKNEPVDNE
ncbi:MAG: hypothetical protein HC799_19005 [Limnothrix sp. RL_2_0]|nr:hypothetical protein [Limnothrix sp. RL_2_0]